MKRMEFQLFYYVGLIVQCRTGLFGVIRIHTQQHVLGFEKIVLQKPQTNGTCLGHAQGHT